ncbi:MAG TPA: hypothetical protein VJY35_02650 [Candidatus Eisenbacteria bacterium]|nr:hypothetical protein [Candidatus Eisenbacteria bacterium]
MHRGALAVLAIILTAAAGSAQASPVTAVGGYDHYAGPLGQNIDAVLGAVVLGAGGSDLMLAGVRYDDNLSGQGITVTGGVGVPLAPMTKLRINATRIIADETFRAWRARVGPQLSLPRGTSLSLWYAHYQDHLGGRSNGAIAEAAAPIVPKLSGRASASYATTSQGPPAVQGSVGLGWSVVSHLELSGELGLARNASGAAGTPGGGGPLGGLPILGGSNGGSSGGTVEQVDTTFLIGLRVTLP